MKKHIAILLLTAALSSTSLASSNKICFGSSTNEDTKGVVLTAEISKEEIIIKTREGDFYNGTYPAYKSVVKGTDGNIYHEYKGVNDDDQNVIVVDQLLLLNESAGVIQFRARGEAFNGYVFDCRDTRY